MLQTTGASEYHLSFTYGIGGFLADQPVVLTEEQAQGISAGNPESFPAIFQTLMGYHRINTGSEHPLLTMPSNEIVPTGIGRLEVILRKVEPKGTQ